MQFQIDRIILWPRNHAFKARELKFQNGMLNVISGLSKTGKSAIIPIIDYCLGAGKCAIPSGVIREKCEWFGVVIKTDEGEKLFARPEPGQSKIDNRIYFIEGNQVETPERISDGNTIVEQIKRRLDDLAKLTPMPFEADSSSPSDARPSFRDMMSFCFQPQNIVANPDVLFFKADTFEHREKIRTIFPYVLGAITSELLVLRARRDELAKLLRRKEREREVYLASDQKWQAEINTWLSKAAELGLTPAVSEDGASSSEAILMLKAIAKKTSDDAHVSEGTIKRAVSEYANLDREEVSTAFDLTVLKRRLSDMERLRKTMSEYSGALGVQRDRLELSTWLSGLAGDTSECPLCHSEFDAPLRSLEELIASLRQIEKTSDLVSSSAPEYFDRDLSRIHTQVRIKVEALETIKARKSELARVSDEAKRAKYRTTEIERFLGGLERALSTNELISPSAAISQEIEDLKNEIKDIDAKMKAQNYAPLLANARRRVEGFANQIIPDTDAEWKDSPITLVTEELTLKVSRPAREDYLWEIGSGANWLAYHVAILIALHKHFLSLKSSPVPSLLIFDQPSQVYFPQKLAGVEQEAPDLDDKDVDAVHKVFAVLSKAVIDAKGNLQILVMDHASDNVWGGLDGIHRAGNWRVDKLVPVEWELAQ